MTRARSYSKYMGGQKARFVGADTETHTLTGVNIMRDQDKAILVEIAADVEIWLPKSQIKSIDGDTIVITGWIARKKGLLT